uniref:glutathione-specific gamma-glutamylcyclotransferase n=1 Tax=Panagrellus redivivus TaxID=6233 RepID=A0A7E4UYD7_PANRE
MYEKDSLSLGGGLEVSKTPILCSTFTLSAPSWIPAIINRLPFALRRSGHFPTTTKLSPVPIPSSSNTKMYVFGYGSLLWYTDFPFVETIPGTVRGYNRRFWQLSPDHRGTADKPGRTVTLVPAEGGETWGVAYKVPDEHVESTFAYLNFRERAGYRCEQVEFHPDDGSAPFNLHVYISLEDINNPYNAGPSDMDDIVSTILSSRGRSGTNLEYALRLADCQRRMAPHFEDDHLFELERRLIDSCAKLHIQDNILRILGHDLPHLKSGEKQVNQSELPPAMVLPMHRLEVASGMARRG